MGDDAADLVGVVELHGAGLVIVVVRVLQRVDLRQEAHGRVVEEAAYDGGALDEPVWCVSYELCFVTGCIFLLTWSGTYQTLGNTEFDELENRYP